MEHNHILHRNAPMRAYVRDGVNVTLRTAPHWLTGGSEATSDATQERVRR